MQQKIGNYEGDGHALSKLIQQYRCWENFSWDGRLSIKQLQKQLLVCIWAVHWQYQWDVSLNRIELIPSGA